jgi:hypothetical protein
MQLLGMGTWSTVSYTNTSKRYCIVFPCYYLFNSLLYCTRFTMATYYYVIGYVQLGFTVDQLGTAAAPISVHLDKAVAEGPLDMGGNQCLLPEGDNQPEGGSQPVEDKRQEHPPGAGSDKQHRGKVEEHSQVR